jgi:hypothetical protein
LSFAAGQLAVFQGASEVPISAGELSGTDNWQEDMPNLLDHGNAQLTSVRFG